jgi:fluoroquinolone transport system permease protein
MKLKALLRGDVRFQYKYGFYFLYLLLSVLYIAVLFSLPAACGKKRRC